MNILINASNLKKGGGLQVADSICCGLDQYHQHKFVVVLSSFLKATMCKIQNFENVEVIKYDIKNNFCTLVLGRDRLLDSLVVKNRVNCVLTIFGPSRWNPKCLHISGFARPHLVLKESPYFQNLPMILRLKEKLKNRVLKYLFARSTHFFYTENPMISARLERLIKKSKVVTISNYYNQVFDNPGDWMEYKLPTFDGISILTISANYPHKNLPIAIEIAENLRNKYPEFNFRFIFTLDAAEFPPLQAYLKKYFLFIGRVDIRMCPSLYKQSNILFQPTLLECFSATYAEAMRMKRPIVTTDLDFSQGLCGAAALYYDSLSARDAAEAIYKVSTDQNVYDELVEKGLEQLTRFDDYNERLEKILSLCEQLYEQNIYKYNYVHLQK